MASLNDQLIGHQKTMHSLYDALKNQRLASTLLFSGPSGCGKKLAARALAQALVCEKLAVPGCGECGPCKRVDINQSESLCTVIPDGVAIKTEQAHTILSFLNLRQLGRARVVIIDQAHLLNQQAGNALLKSLEEPPDGTYFLLITSMASSVLSTIRSRAQLVRFKPLTHHELAQVLGQTFGVDADPWIVEAAQGSMERALQLGEKREEFEKVESVVNQFMRVAPHNLPSAEIMQMRELTKDKSMQVFVANHFQRVLLDGLRLQAGLEPSLTSKTSENLVSIVNEIAQFEAKALQNLADLSIEIEQDMMRNVDRGLVFENFAIQWKVAARLSAAHANRSI